MRAGTGCGGRLLFLLGLPAMCHISERGPNHVTLMSSHPRLFSHFLHFRPVQPACPASHHPNPLLNLGQYPHVESRHGFKHRCAYVLSTGASWRCAWICHRRHCLRVTRSQIAGRSLQKSSPRYITIHPSPSFFLPLQPLSSPPVPCSS